MTAVLQVVVEGYAWHAIIKSFVDVLFLDFDGLSNMDMDYGKGINAKKRG